MHPGDPVTIPYPITSFRHILPALKGGETGLYIRPAPNGLGEVMHEIEINGKIYPLRESEWIAKEKGLI